MIVVCNFSPEHRDGYRVGAPFGGRWAVVLNTDDQQFGGQGLGDKEPLKTEKVPCHDQQQSLVIDLPPMSAVIYRCVRKNPARRSKADKEEGAKAEKAAPVKGKKAPAKEKKAPTRGKKTPAGKSPKH